MEKGINTTLTLSVYEGAKREIRGKRSDLQKSSASPTYEKGEEALSDAICSNNSINNGSGAGSLSATLAHFSEVTQGKVGGRGEKTRGERGRN